MTDEYYDEDGFRLEFEDDTSDHEKQFFMRAFPNVNKISERKVHCTSCYMHIGTAPITEAVIRMHPVLRVTHCRNCHTFYNSGEFDKGEDGSELYCRWCGQGGEVYCCSKCPYVFCKKCIVQNLSRACVQDISRNDNWQCFSCAPKIMWHLRAQHWALSNYIEKQKKDMKDKNLSVQTINNLMKQDNTTCCSNKGLNKKAGGTPVSAKKAAKRASDAGDISSPGAAKIPEKRSAPMPSKQTQSQSPAQQPPVKKQKTDNNEVVCTPDIMSMFMNPEESVPLTTQRAPAAPKAVPVTPKVAPATPPTTQLPNRQVVVRPAIPNSINPIPMRMPVSANPVANAPPPPVYHTINGYRIDLHTAAQQGTYRLPNGKLIQVRKQAPAPTVAAVPAPVRNNIPIAPKPTNQYFNPTAVMQNPAARMTNGAPNSNVHINMALQQQQHMQEQRLQQQRQQQQHHQQQQQLMQQQQQQHQQQQQRQHQQMYQPVQPQPTIVAGQPNPALQLPTLILLQNMVNGPHEDSPLGRSRKNFEGKLLSGVEICQHIVSKINTLTNSNSFKNIRNARDLKELYIHVSYLLTYAIGRFKTLQEKCVDDVKKMGFTKESDFVMMGDQINNRNPEEDKSDDEDDCEIIEQNTTLIELDSEDEDDGKKKSKGAKEVANANKSASAAAAAAAETAAAVASIVQDDASSNTDKNTAAKNLPAPKIAEPERAPKEGPVGGEKTAKDATEKTAQVSRGVSLDSNEKDNDDLVEIIESPDDESVGNQTAKQTEKSAEKSADAVASDSQKKADDTEKQQVAAKKDENESPDSSVVQISSSESISADSEKKTDSDDVELMEVEGESPQKEDKNSSAKDSDKSVESEAEVVTCIDDDDAVVIVVEKEGKSAEKSNKTAESEGTTITITEDNEEETVVTIHAESSGKTDNTAVEEAETEVVPIEIDEDEAVKDDDNPSENAQQDDSPTVAKDDEEQAAEPNDKTDSANNTNVADDKSPEDKQTESKPSEASPDVVENEDDDSAPKSSTKIDEAPESESTAVEAPEADTSSKVDEVKSGEENAPVDTLKPDDTKEVDATDGEPSVADSTATDEKSSEPDASEKEPAQESENIEPVSASLLTTDLTEEDVEMTTEEKSNGSEASAKQADATETLEQAPSESVSESLSISDLPQDDVDMTAESTLSGDNGPVSSKHVSADLAPNPTEETEALLEPMSGDDLLAQIEDSFQTLQKIFESTETETTDKADKQTESSISQIEESDKPEEIEPTTDEAMEVDGEHSTDDKNIDAAVAEELGSDSLEPVTTNEDLKELELDEQIAAKTNEKQSDEDDSLGLAKITSLQEHISNGGC